MGLYRGLAVDNPAFTPDLAMALNNLGVFLSELGRRAEALAPTHEAVDLYRGLAADNPAFTPDLARSLANLGDRFGELGTPGRLEPVWREVLDGLEPPARAQLLLLRSRSAPDGDPDAAGWLAEAVAAAGEDQDLGSALREEVRRHRGADPTGLDAAWRAHTGGSVPGWAALDSDLLGLARVWFASPSYSAEHDHLAAHPELLDAAADDAMGEALLAVPAAEVDRYRSLRDTARRDGTAAAYRPLLLTVLAYGFAVADPAGQREMLVTRREDLLDDHITRVLADAAEQDEQWTFERAQALLALAADPAATGVLEEIFDALADPALFPALLRRTARDTDPARLGPVARCALSAATTDSQAATAVIYLAIAATLAGDSEQAGEALAAARGWDPDARDPWITEIAAIGGTHPRALGLIPALLTPPSETTLDDGPDPTSITPQERP